MHEYELKPGAQPDAFERALHEAEGRGLLALPGLVDHHFLRGLKGARRGRYAAVWVYESTEAWEALWGTPMSPRPFFQYAENWRIFEGEVLAAFLKQDPDTIRFTTYQGI